MPWLAAFGTGFVGHVHWVSHLYFYWNLHLYLRHSLCRCHSFRCTAWFVYFFSASLSALHVLLKVGYPLQPLCSPCCAQNNRCIFAGSQRRFSTASIRCNCIAHISNYRMTETFSTDALVSQARLLFSTATLGFFEDSVNLFIFINSGIWLCMRNNERSTLRVTSFDRNRATVTFEIIIRSFVVTSLVLTRRTLDTPIFENRNER